MSVFTLEDEQFVWTDKSSGFCPSDVNLCCDVIGQFIHPLVRKRPIINSLVCHLSITADNTSSEPNTFVHQLRFGQIYFELKMYKYKMFMFNLPDFAGSMPPSHSDICKSWTGTIWESAAHLKQEVYMLNNSVLECSC